MRFEVSRVMDTIEQRLTTDVALAQAVVDLADVARFVALDGGRPINLLRLGMVIDALSRYLIDAGAMLYPVVGRELLSEASLTSKERMVLGRWADDGLIEVTPVVGDRAVEIADFTGLPLIAVRDPAEHAERFQWLRDSPERILRLLPRAGGAVLVPGGDTLAVDPSIPAVVVGKAAARRQLPAEVVDVGDEPVPDELVEAVETGVIEVADVAAEEAEAERHAGEAAQEAAAEAARDAAPEAAQEAPAPDATRADDKIDLFDTFRTRGFQRFTRTRVVRLRFTRAEPSAIGASLMARQWQCAEPDCPAFGGYRRIGQPVPRMRGGVPACPRHGQAVKDTGPRPPAYAVAVVVDDLARRRFVVTEGRPVVVGRDPVNPDDISVGGWLHEAAAGWIAEDHLRLEVNEGRLSITDMSENGTLVWKRSGPDDHGETTRLYKSSYQMGDWDSIELYTGVELVPSDHRLSTTVGSEPLSVLVDAPTVALLLPDFGKK